MSKFFNKRFEEKDKKEGLLERPKHIEEKSEVKKSGKQLKAIEDQWEKQLDAIKKNQLKDDETKNIVLLKDRLKELIESYPKNFNTFEKNELK